MSKYIYARCSPSEHEFLVKIAKDDGLTMAAFLRRCVNAYLREISGEMPLLEEQHDCRFKANRKVVDASDAAPVERETKDLAELALTPVSYETPIDHYREMARRFAESRDELKHRCRTLETQHRELVEQIVCFVEGLYDTRVDRSALVFGVAQHIRSRFSKEP